MKNKELAERLLQNPEDEVKILVVGQWHLAEEIKQVKSNNTTTVITVDNPETKHR